MMNDPAQQIDRIRAFNRFYTRQIGLLAEGMLSSGYSLTEMRLLYELSYRTGTTAADLGRDLSLDAGYLSRIVKKFEVQDLITREVSSADARQTLLALTPKGEETFAPLNARSNELIGRLLSPLAPFERRSLVEAMNRIQSLLDPPASERHAPPASFVLRGMQIGDIGWITRRQGMLYAEEYGWDESYEALVAEIAATFVKTFDPKREACWIAERQREIVGSVFLVRVSDEVAKLRLLYVEPSSRGLGIGKRLIDECISFARRRRYRTMTLWTNDVLLAARHLYKHAGFTLVHTEAHHSFGHDLVGETWELAL